MAQAKGLRERLAGGGNIIIAEGYILELERRGYLTAGAMVPEVVIDHPEVLRNLHEEWVHAGSDVVEACTYFANRSQLELIGRADDYETLNRRALQIAREVADKHGKLMAGNICNTLMYTPNSSTSDEKIASMFQEQIKWAVDEKADLVIAETYRDLGEAMLALKCIKQYGNGLPAVVTIAPPPSGKTFDGYDIAEACRQLEDAGADVIGLNCLRGPDSMLPVIKQVRQACKGPLACVPCPIRTDSSYKVMHQFRDARTGARACPLELDAFLCSRSHIRAFAEEARELGIQYIGLCCGNRAIYMREVAEAFGRTPPASKYTLRADQHFTKTDDPERRYQREHYEKSLVSYPLN